MITGAAGGLGSEMARLLCVNGAKVYILDLDAEKGRATAEDIAGRGGFARFIRTDVTCEADWQAAVARAVEECGRLDVLVNNAGGALNKPFEETTDEEYDRLMDINARVPFRLCRRMLPLLRRSECPTIINIGSVVSHKGYVRQAAYSASKHALLGMTKALAREVAPEGIRVHLLAPGGVFTDMVRIARPDLSPEGMIQPEEVAELAAFLVEHRGNAVIDEIQVHRVGKEPFM